MNNYYNEKLEENYILEKDIYFPVEQAKIFDYNFQEFVNTEYYPVKRTRAKLNVYIRKSN